MPPSRDANQDLYAKGLGAVYDSLDGGIEARHISPPVSTPNLRILPLCGSITMLLIFHCSSLRQPVLTCLSVGFKAFEQGWPVQVPSSICTALTPL